MSDDHTSESSTRGDSPADEKAAPGTARDLLERIRRLAARGRESAEALAQQIVRRARSIRDVPRSGADEVQAADSRVAVSAPLLGRAAERRAPEANALVVRDDEELRPDPLATVDEEPRPELLATVDEELRPELLATVDEELPPLPPDYGDRRVVLLARDPHWLFCYWDLSTADREPPAPGRLALRLHDVTDIDYEQRPSWSQHIFPLEPGERWRHLPLPQLERNYLAEVGYLWPSGAFGVLARSGLAAAPSAEPDDDGPVASEATVELDGPLPGPLSEPFPTPPSPGGPGVVRGSPEWGLAEGPSSSAWGGSPSGVGFRDAQS